MKRLALISAVTVLATGTGGATAAASPSRVGHTVQRIVVEGSNPLPDPRRVDVHLWYPADHKGFSGYDMASYTSALKGRPLPPPSTPLSWSVDAEVAREGAPIDPRVRDIAAVLDQLPSWLGDRADVSRAGVMGHSRGTVSALAAAGGALKSNVEAVMGMAIGTQTVTDVANLAGVEAPTLLVAGALDATSPQSVSEYAFDRIQSRLKAFASITHAVHRSFDSTYCDQVQAAGTIAEADTNAILDLHTARGILIHASSGVATQYCSAATFTGIEDFVATQTGLPFPANVPTTGLETDEVKRGMAKLAAAFFGSALTRTGDPYFRRYLAPKRLPMIGCAEVVVDGEEILPPGCDL
jgi:pimeloyl-ACP methyl ester carboxylesterase